MDLEDTDTRGARRISDALARLEDLRLIDVQLARGETSIITVLKENGSGRPYSLPGAEREPRYLQVPDALWNGHIQRMQAPGLAMLLVLLAEPSSLDGSGTWWSVSNFPAWYNLSASMRAKGTNELVDLGLLRVSKRMLDTPRGGRNSDDRDRVRNVYRLTGPANLRQPLKPRSRLSKVRAQR